MKTVIEINGRKYDARTGALILDDLSSPKPADDNTAKQKSPIRTTASNVDGINRHPARPVTAQKIARNIPSVAKVSKKTSSASQSLDIRPAQKKTQRSNTLVRSVVKKSVKIAPQVHSTSSINASTVEKSASGRGMLLRRIPDIRLSRAKETAKSITIHRFSGVSSFKKQPILNDTLAVAKAPDLPTSSIVAPAITKPALVTVEKEQVFAHPIAHATNHLSPRLKKDKLHVRIGRKIRVSPKIVSIGVASFALIFVLGFLAYQNIPSVAMKIAANRAGFSGNLPGTTPAGFSFNGPLQYGKGYITLQFGSNSDARKFAITQRPTDWTSEALLATQILTSNQKYQTYHDKGLTVYIYSNGDATWVDKGVWYNLSGQGALSSEQVLAIAGSM